MDELSIQAQKLAQLQAQIEGIANIVNSKAKNLEVKESLLRQGQLPSFATQDVEQNLARSLGPILAPGNLGDLNKIIWPYWFSTEAPTEPIGLNQTLQTGFSVTQEAAFIFMSFTKTVYLENGLQWVYLDPNDEANQVNQAPGLTFTMRDTSSSRQFFNTPMQLSHYGNPRFPSKYPKPTLILPNQEMEINFTNSHPTNQYVPVITAFGYRCRVEDAQNLLGTVFA